MSDAAPWDAILHYWLDEVGPEGWYKSDDGVDAEITRRFGELWRAERDGTGPHWPATPRARLARLILLDQFPRNMFRDDPRAFATDAQALALAEAAIAADADLAIPEPERQFFYLPLMHAEAMEAQDTCLDLIARRMPEKGAENHLHARAHREVIARFGRFPHRNAALGRETTAEEAAFLDTGGYGRVVRELKGE